MDSETQGTTPQDLGESTPSETAMTEQPKEEWQTILDSVLEFVAKLPALIAEFFTKYKTQAIVIGLVIGAIVSVRLTLAILGAINDIPLLSPLFELIGLGYSAWFIYRYLLKASDRSDLVEDFNALKAQVLGNSNSSTNS